MSDWNSNQYLKFKNERSQPAIDLANRLHVYSFKTALDLGCGPGNSTNILKEIYPDVEVIGIDSSINMIQKAKNTYPTLSFELKDIWKIDKKVDLLFSNACLQWIDEHEKLLPFLMSHLNDGGILAVQIPMNQEEPLFKIIKEVVQEFDADFRNVHFQRNDVLTPNEYYNILSKCSKEFTIWESVYTHEMNEYMDLIEWVKGTRLRPYLDVLDERQQMNFIEEILTKTKIAYPRMDNGKILLRFRRFFFVAIR